jgi:hypothetical protein
MSLPGPGNPISIRDINAEFGLGYDLGSYRGKRYFFADGRTGTFPDTELTFSDFYSTQTSNPVTPSTVTFNQSGVFAVPASYTTMIVTVRGGGGGAGGATGRNQCLNDAVTFGVDGLSGGQSTFGVYASASGGGGGRATGERGVNGGPTCDGIPAGGGGFGGGGSGGAGGYETVTLISPQAGGGGPTFNSIVNVTVGLGGVGGQGGPNFQVWSGVCTLINYATRGQNGVNGSVFISWT